MNAERRTQNLEGKKSWLVGSSFFILECGGHAAALV